MSMTWLRSAAPLRMAPLTLARLAATSCSADVGGSEVGLLELTAAELSTSMNPSGGAKLTFCTCQGASQQPKHTDNPLAAQGIQIAVQMCMRTTITEASATQFAAIQPGGFCLIDMCPDPQQSHLAAHEGPSAL